MIEAALRKTLDEISGSQAVAVWVQGGKFCEGPAADVDVVEEEPGISVVVRSASGIIHLIPQREIVGIEVHPVTEEF